jgi:hypothetical protein
VTISSFAIALSFEIPSLESDSFLSVILSLEKVTILTFSWDLRYLKDCCQISKMCLTRLEINEVLTIYLGLVEEL